MLQWRVFPPGLHLVFAQALNLFGSISIYSYSSFFCHIETTYIPFHCIYVRCLDGVLLSLVLASKRYGKFFHKAFCHVVLGNVPGSNTFRKLRRTHSFHDYSANSSFDYGFHQSVKKSKVRNHYISWRWIVYANAG